MMQWQQMQFVNPEEMYKKQIRMRTKKVGWICLAFLIAQVVIAMGDMFIGIIATAGKEISLTTYLIREGLIQFVFLNMVEYIVLLGLPLLTGLWITRKDAISPVYVKKMSPSFGIGLFLVGLGVVVVGNWVNEVWLIGLSGIGISPAEMPDTQDGSVQALILNILMVGILPAILEELVFRGLILQSLRFAGDTIAIVVSGILFGLMHGTINQIPFAIILGIYFGYVALKTGNILLSMALHFANNTVAVIMEYVTYGMETADVARYETIYFVVVGLLGILGMAILAGQSRTKLFAMGDNGQAFLSQKSRWKIVLTEPTILVFVGCMIFMTLLSIDMDGLTDIMNQYDSFQEGIEGTCISVWSMLHG